MKPTKSANASTRHGATADARPDAGGSVVESVIAHLKQGLRAGRYAPGQRLIESDICARVDASRGSVREAMRRLAAEGIVDIEHHKGARIRFLDLAEALEIYQVRESLEGLAAELAARNVAAGASAASLIQLERDFDDAFDGSPTKYMTYNLAFHRAIVKIANNSRLTSLIEQLELPAFLSMLQIIVDPLSVELSRGEHRPIMAAILAGDGEAASRAMRKHIGRTADHIRKQANRADRDGRATPNNPTAAKK